MNFNNTNRCRFIFERLDDAAFIYRYLVAALDKLGLAYLHIMHNDDEMLLGDIPALWKQSLILNRPGRPLDQIGADVASGLADLEAYGQVRHRSRAMWGIDGSAEGPSSLPSSGQILAVIFPGL